MNHNVHAYLVTQWQALVRRRRSPSHNHPTGYILASASLRLSPLPFLFYSPRRRADYCDLGGSKHSTTRLAQAIPRFCRVHQPYQRLKLLGFNTFRSSRHKVVCLNARNRMGEPHPRRTTLANSFVHHADKLFRLE
jgi:hypothetical protein